MMDSVTKKNMTRAQLYGGVQLIHRLCEELERATNASGWFDQRVTERMKYLREDADTLARWVEDQTYGDMRNAPASPASPIPPDDGKDTAGVK